MANLMAQLDLIHDTERETTRFGEVPKFQEGLYELTPGIYTWMVPNGSWGESNAGLIVGDGSSLLIDTLWDLKCTREMLDAMKPITDSAPIKTVVNTHADGDHFWGNELLKGANIIASQKAAEEMVKIKPKTMILLSALGKILSKINFFNLDQAGHAFKTMLSPYDFKKITHTPPNRTFTGEMTLHVGDRAVHLVEVGPAHTEGDILVYIPSSKIVFASDILFIGSTPVMWAGPVRNILSALDKILSLKAEKIVPGHGPVTNDNGVKTVKDYWNFISENVRDCFKKGWNAEKTATEIALSEEFKATIFWNWNSPERVMANTHTIYRELQGRKDHPKPKELIKIMRKQAILAHKMPDAEPAIMRKTS